MDNGSTRIFVGNRDGFALNHNIKGLRLSCFVLFIAVGIIFTLAGVWLSMQGTRFEMTWDGPSIVSFQPLNFYPGIGMLFFGLISLVFAFDFTGSDWSFYYTYFNLKYSRKPKLENGRILYGFFARKIMPAVDAMDDKTKGGLLLILLTDIPYALVMSLISVLILAFTSAAAGQIFSMSLSGLVLISVIIIVLLGCLTVQKAFRHWKNQLPREPTYVPLPPDDPITGSWSGFNQHIKLVFQKNGTFEMIVTSFDGKDRTYSSGTVRKDTEGYYWIKPQSHGSSKEDALPCEERPSALELEGDILEEIPYGLIFSRESSSLQDWVNKSGFITSK